MTFRTCGAGGPRSILKPGEFLAGLGLGFVARLRRRGLGPAEPRRLPPRGGAPDPERFKRSGDEAPAKAPEITVITEIGGAA